VGSGSSKGVKSPFLLFSTVGVQGKPDNLFSELTNAVGGFIAQHFGVCSLIVGALIVGAPVLGYYF